MKYISTGQFLLALTATQYADCITHQTFALRTSFDDVVRDYARINFPFLKIIDIVV